MPTKKERLCYFCGLPGAVTKDHIPPRLVFPHQPTGNLVTVPAHKLCNKSFEKDDVLLRDIIVSICAGFSLEGLRAWQKQVIPSWSKDPGARARLRALLTGKLQHDPATNILRMRQAIKMPEDLVKRQVRRWTRGLYYRRFGRPLSQDAVLEVDVYEDARPVVVAFTEACLAENKMPLWVNIEPGVFRYFYGASTDSDEQGVIVFEFFGRQAYVASINLGEE